LRNVPYVGVLVGNNVLLEVCFELCSLSHPLPDAGNASVLAIVEVAPHHLVRPRCLDELERSAMVVGVLGGDDPWCSPLASVQRIVGLLHLLHFLSVPDGHERVVEAKLGILTD
jgi:hypothetical protein